ncbi:MAG: putative transcriptional regulator [Pseudohongiellaceae bacterium]
MDRKNRTVYIDLCSPSQTTEKSAVSHHGAVVNEGSGYDRSLHGVEGRLSSEPQVTGEENPMESSAAEQAFLVVASPDLQDPHFRQTVVLMVQHDREGAFGLILNRPLDRMLGEVIGSDNEIEPVSQDILDVAARVPLYRGGPVATDVVQFASATEGCGRLVLPGVVLGADLLELSCAATAAADEHPLRAYAGYAGWGAGQLERETEEGSWIIAPASRSHVFDVAHDALWATVLRELGGSYAWMALDGGEPGNN